jgi:hypothetical protein
MNMPELFGSWAPWIVAGLVLLEFGVVLVREGRARRSLERSLDAQSRIQAELRHELQALLGCSRGIGERLSAHGVQLLRLAERQSQIEREHGEERHVAASALLAAGATPVEVARRCGLSRGEAELMQHVRELRGGAARAH